MAIVQDRTVFPDSKEWQFLEFALQLHLSTSRAKLLQAWDVSLPETVAAFNAKSSVSHASDVEPASQSRVLGC